MIRTLKLTQRMTVAAVALATLLLLLPLGSANAADEKLGEKWWWGSRSDTTQHAERWRSDSGDEETAGWATEENADLPGAALNTVNRVRFGVENDSKDVFTDEDALLLVKENRLGSSVIDTDNGFAYFGTDTDPGKIIKINTNTFKRAGVMTLQESSGGGWWGTDGVNPESMEPDWGWGSDPGESHLLSAAIDAGRGYAYFATNTDPAKVIKIDLNTFTKVATLELDYENARAAVIDTSGSTHYLYIGHNESPGRVTKIDLNTFEIDDVLNTGDDGKKITSGAIDTAEGYLYFGTYTGSARVVKVDLSTFSHEDTLWLSGDNNKAVSMVIDTSHETHYAYVGCEVNPGRVVKVNLDTFRKEGRGLSTGSEKKHLRSASIDMANGYLYFTSRSDNAFFVRVDLNATFDNDAVVKMKIRGSDNRNPVTHVLDAANGYAYLGLDSGNGRIIRVDLAGFDRLTAATIDPDGGMELNPAPPIENYEILRLGLEEADPSAAVIDPEAGFAYVGVSESRMESGMTSSNGGPSTNDLTSRVLKIDLETFSRVDELELPYVLLSLDSSYEEDTPSAAVIDTVNGYAYFGMANGMVAKIDLDTFEIDGMLELSSGSATPPVTAGVIDVDHGFAYFALGPGRIVKVDLGGFYVYDTLWMGTSGGLFRAASIDAEDEYAFFGRARGTIYKIDLNPFSSVDSLQIGSGSTGLGEDWGDDGLVSASVIDPDNERVYFTRGRRIYKINEFDGFYVEDDKGLLMFSGNLTVAGIDTERETAYFGGGLYSALIVEVDLDRFRVEDWTSLMSTRGGLQGGVIDPSRGYFYFGVDNSDPAKLIRVNYAVNNRYQLEYAPKVEGCGDIRNDDWTRVPNVAGMEHWQMADSPMVVDGVPTTNVDESDGISDPKGRFSPGQFKDTQPVTSNLPITKDEFSEIEFGITPTVNAMVGSKYCFRLTDLGDDDEFDYDEYAVATPTAGGGMRCDAPNIDLTIPDGGEVYPAGGTVEMFWSAWGCDVTGVRISLSTDGGSTYPTVIEESAYPGDGFYRWDIPVDHVYTEQARIRLELLGIGGEVRFADASEGNFTIQGIPAPPPIEPDGQVPGIPFNPQGFGGGAAGPLTIDENQNLPFAPVGTPQFCSPGMVMLGSVDTAYYCGRDVNKYMFPNVPTYATWYDDWGPIVPMPDELLAQVPDGGIVYYYPGKRMLKVPASVAVYAVDFNGLLHWVPNEAVAELVYGPDWRDFVDDIPAEYFAHYTIGVPLGLDGTLPGGGLGMTSLGEGDTLWSVVKREASNLGLKSDLLTLARQVAKANEVAVPEWGIKGLKNARSLSTGSRLDLSSLFNALRNR